MERKTTKRKTTKRKTTSWNWKEALVGKARRRSKPFPTLFDVEAEHIKLVLEAYDFDILHSAKALGIARSTLYRKMKRLDLY